MRQFNFFYLYALVASCVLTACEDVVNLPSDTMADLVVFSNFSDQNSLEVYVYKTRSVLSNTPTEYVKNAEVKVFAGGQLLEVLQLVEPDDAQNFLPFYKTTHLLPEFDKEYTIEVSVEGYQTITAKNSIPSPVNLEDVSFEPQVTTGKGSNIVVDFLVSVSLRDPVGIENFYHLKFYQELTPYSVLSNGDTLFGRTYLAPPTFVDKLGEVPPLIKYNNDQSFLIRDTYFDGQYITLKFTGHYSFDPSMTRSGNFLIELRTVSKAYFLYHESLNWQNQPGDSNSDGDVFFNNIDNGVGNFSGFTSKVNSFKVTD